MLMKRKSFRPALDPMESRIALSGTSIFTQFFDNLFGQSTNSTSTPKYTPAEIAKIKANNLAKKEAHEAKVAEFKAEHPHAR